MREEELDAGTYTKRNVEIVNGQGACLWDVNGKVYIDMGASYGVCNVGHRNPEVLEAVKRQGENIFYIASTYPNPVRRELMESIISITPAGLARCFICNSGTEAVEAGIKFAVYSTKRKKLVAAMRAFHGRTLGSLSLTWNKKFREDFQDILIPVNFVRYNDEESLKDAVDSDTAAVILEPVQGEGGVNIPDKDYFKAVRDICTDSGALLIDDEIQTGMGRTGRMFCVEHYNVTPDIMCIGKSLGGGFPIAATVLHENLGPMKKGIHGSTFGGNPLACAAAHAAIDFTVKKDLPGRAAELGDYFLDKLRSLTSPNIREVRGLGLMLAVELKSKATPYLNKLLDRGIAPLPAGATYIRLLPPLVVEQEDIDKTVTVLEESLSEA
ncbi:aspartate aminotransferase family protein [[Eubacterium] cellulosolvens]